jgi:hypothetical protein
VKKGAMQFPHIARVSTKKQAHRKSSRFRLFALTRIGKWKSSGDLFDSLMEQSGFAVKRKIYRSRSFIV